METTECAILASRPEVGSSTRSTAGCASSSIPIETRFRWPPERPRSSTLPIFVRPSSSDRWSSRITDPTRSARSARVALRGSESCAANESISRAVSPGSSTSSCGIVLISCRAVRRDSGAPLMVIAPEEHAPVRRTSSSVVLPAPDGPMTAVSEPGSKLKSTPSRI